YRALAGSVDPVTATIDALRSIVMPTWSETRPGEMWPGHLTIAGTRMPPSHTVHFRLNRGLLLDTHSPPLSLVKITMVLFVRPSRSRVRRIWLTPWSTDSTMAA